MEGTRFAPIHQRIVTWDIDGALLAALDASTNGVLSGNNILFMQGDINSTASTSANGTALNFGLFDNVTVSSVSEPTISAISLLSVAGWYLARRSRK